MHGGRNGDEGGARVYACAHAALEHCRELFVEMATNGFAAIEVGLTSCFDFGKNCTGHIITRSQLALFMIIGHKPYAFGICQDRAFTTQSFCGEGGWVASNINRCWMKLNKFHIAQFCANNGGHAQRITAGCFWICRDGE